MQPPWSTATSTITEPCFNNFRSARLTSLGALAPVRSTAPITTSALASCSRTLWRFQKSRGPFGGKTLGRYDPASPDETRHRRSTPHTPTLLPPSPPPPPPA